MRTMMIKSSNRTDRMKMRMISSNSRWMANKKMRRKTAKT